MNMVSWDIHQGVFPVIHDARGNARDLGPLLATLLSDTIVEGNWTDDAEQETLCDVGDLPLLAGGKRQSRQGPLLRDALSFRLSLADRAAASELRGAVQRQGFSATAASTVERATLRWNPLPDRQAKIAIELGVTAVFRNAPLAGRGFPDRVLAYCTFRSRRTAPPLLELSHG